MPNILQLQKELESVPDDRLIQEVSAPNVYPAYLSAQELQRRQQLRESYNVRMQQVPQGTVKDRLISSALQGIGSIPQEQAATPMPAAMAMAQQGPPMMQGGMPPQGGMPMQMPMGAMAEGGIVGYSNGSSANGLVGQAQGYSNDPDDPELDPETLLRLLYRPSEMIGLASEPASRIRFGAVDELLPFLTGPDRDTYDAMERARVGLSPTGGAGQELPGLGGSLEDSQELDMQEGVSPRVPHTDAAAARAGGRGFNLNNFGMLAPRPESLGEQIQGFSLEDQNQRLRQALDLSLANPQNEVEEARASLQELIRQQMEERISQRGQMTPDMENYHTAELEEAQRRLTRAEQIAGRDRARIAEMAEDRAAFVEAIQRREDRLSGRIDPEADEQDRIAALLALSARAIGGGRFQEGGIGGALGRGTPELIEMRRRQLAEQRATEDAIDDLSLAQITGVSQMRDQERELERMVEQGVITAEDAIEAARLNRLKTRADLSQETPDLAELATLAAALSELDDASRGRSPTQITGSARAETISKIFGDIFKMFNLTDGSLQGLEEANAEQSARMIKAQINAYQHIGPEERQELYDAVDTARNLAVSRWNEGTEIGRANGGLVGDSALRPRTIIPQP